MRLRVDTTHARERAALLAGVLVAASACTATWTLRAVEPPIALQWPYQPSPAKLTYVRSLTGLARERDSLSVLRSVTIGSESEERNAFVLPVAVATGADGRIAVADMGRACVHLYIPGERRYLQLHGAQQEKIRSPVALAFDEHARLYVSDSTGSVFVFGPDGMLLATLRQAAGEQLRRPTGLAYSPERGLLYVVDTLAHRIHAFEAGGTLAFSFGERGEGEGAFNFPTHIFRARSGELYVTDALNFRVQVFDERGAALGSFGHHGDGSGDLAMPKGVAVDGDGVVYVVDGLFDNVQLFSRRGDFLLTVGRRGADFGEFWLPSGAFISADHELYVCDTYNRRIQVFRITEAYGDATL